MSTLIAYTAGLLFFCAGIFFLIQFYRVALMVDGRAHAEIRAKWPRAVVFLRFMVPVICVGFALNAVICITNIILSVLKLA